MYQGGGLGVPSQGAAPKPSAAPPRYIVASTARLGSRSLWRRRRREKHISLRLPYDDGSPAVGIRSQITSQQYYSTTRAVWKICFRHNFFKKNPQDIEIV